MGSPAGCGWGNGSESCFFSRVKGLLLSMASCRLEVVWHFRHFRVYSG
ncbi:MAG: hypothetical protein HQM04_02305 [Magnetococcales bacterium]|nr:hypothetical protein [Magnetococcales bacterium]MBF0113852.1 hypothetical protein [Magnetococcales bacterium]